MKVVNESASLKRLADNRWIRLSTIDPATGRVQILRDGEFEDLDGAVERLPVALSSPEWYGGKLEHLAMAWIQSEGGR
jgi:hypothetical protein